MNTIQIIIYATGVEYHYTMCHPAEELLKEFCKGGAGQSVTLVEDAPGIMREYPMKITLRKAGENSVTGE